MKNIKTNMTTEECDRCGYADVSWCMSNGCDKGQRRLEWMEEVGIIKSDCLNEFESQTVEWMEEVGIIKKNDVCCVGCNVRVCGFDEEPPHKDNRDEAICNDCYETLSGSDCLNEFESQTVEDIKSCIIIAMEIEDDTAALVVMADYWKQLKESVMNRTKFQEGQALLVDVGKELKLYTLNKWIESLEN